MAATELATHPVSTMLDSNLNPLATLPDFDAPGDLGLLDAISWPWIYESLYLQGDPWDAWPTPVTPDFPAHSPTVPASSSEPALGAGPMAATTTTDGGREYGLAESRSQSPSQERLLTELAAYATQPRLESYEGRRCYWRSMSLRVAKAFGIGDWRAAHTAPTLLRMINLYRQHFAPLWPLLGPQDDDADTLHPLLFLVLTSIGALYGTPSEGAFGVALHEHIRNVLLTPLFSIEEAEENLLPLGQARLLIQVAALYFGQRRAFSYAQHLGAVVLMQARRMDLFSSRRATHLTMTDLSPEAQIRAWCQVEARKRLAFGILRADVFTSVLMNSRPLLSAEEIELELPAPDQLWNPPEPLPADALLGKIIASSSSIPRLPFCDLVRIALDRSEALLDMEPAHYELLLFGLQEPVWRFSHDPNLFLRLTGTNDLLEITHTACDRRRSSTVREDQLGQAHRRMQDLQDNRLQLIEALHKWNRTFTAVRTARPIQDSRTSLMSSLLLYKLSFLRLTAPLEELHSVAYALSNHKPVDNRRLCTLTLWARSPDARIAADFSSQIWRLLAQETERPENDRAKHNLLALAGLHHATVMLWVFAGAQAKDTPVVDLPTLGDAEDADEAITLCPRESPRMVQRIISLSRLLAPVGCGSFTAAAERLSHYTFPARTSNPGGVFSFQ